MAKSPEDLVLAYQDSCAGLTLLFLHGFPLNSNVWEPQMEELRDVARVLAPDLRGHGLSLAGEPPYTMEMMAQDAIRLMETIGVRAPVVVCGHSMGGYLAFEIYRQYPEWVAGLILVSTRAGADSAEGRKNRDEMARQAKQEGVVAIADVMLPKLLAPQNYEEDEELVDFVRDMMESTSMKGMVGALMAMKERPDSNPLLPDIEVPTLVIHGEEDLIVPQAEAEAMYKAIPDATFVSIPGAGHLPSLEQSLAFSEAVWDFLEYLRDGERDEE